MKLNSNNKLIQLIIETMAKNKIIKTTNGKRHISNWPTIDKNRKPTANQIKARERFSGWIKKVKELMEDDDTKKIYAAASKNGLTAYNAAFADVVNKSSLKK